MKSIFKVVMVSAAVIVTGLFSGCGSSGGGGTTAAGGTAPTTAGTPAAAPPAAAALDAAALYSANCAGCHGALSVSTKKGITVARLQNAIANNTGGMGFLSGLTAAEQQTIVSGLNPAVVAPVTPVTPPVTVDGAALYAANCAGCHGALASSAKTGITLARLQSAITGNVGNMGFLSTLNSAQQQAIVTALTPSTPTTPVTPPAAPDGTALYATNCAGCHGALATSVKAGATAARIQTAINGNIGGMGFLSTLTTAQVSALATTLATVTPPTTPPPAATCGSCHAIPPATGKHSFHSGRNIGCATCHGTGYSSTTVNAATHNNGVKNLTTTIGWNATSRSCSNSCHGSRAW
jgi:mono/diheme cytochrome c family protein